MNKNYLIPLFRENFPFWDKLSDADKETFLNSSVDIGFKKGTNIHNGNECTGIILIKTGSLRLYILSDEGKEITLYRLFPGEMCMLSASCVLNNITFDVFVDAEENSECIIVGGCAYAALAERCDEAKIFALETALARFSDVMWVMQQILFMSMDKRLAKKKTRHGKSYPRADSKIYGLRTRGGYAYAQIFLKRRNSRALSRRH